MKAYVAGLYEEKRLLTAIRHAVRDETWWAGLRDAECGKQGAIEVEAWDARDARSCRRCAEILAKDPPVSRQLSRASTDHAER